MAGNGRSKLHHAWEGNAATFDGELHHDPCLRCGGAFADHPPPLPPIPSAPKTVRRGPPKKVRRWISHA